MKKDLIDLVRKLNLPLGEYAVFGSGPMAVRGLRDFKDVDIIVTENLFAELKKNNNYKYVVLPKRNGKVECLQQGKVEIFKTWTSPAWDVNKLIKESQIIDGVPFVRLSDVLAWKREMGREKDLQDVALIENFFKQRQNK